MEEMWTEEDSSYHILCQRPALGGHKMKILGVALMEPIDISRALIKQILNLA
jgi:hypothetical protein